MNGSSTARVNKNAFPACFLAPDLKRTAERLGAPGFPSVFSSPALPVRSRLPFPVPPFPAHPALLACRGLPTAHPRASSASAICFKLLRDLSSSDSVHLRYTIKKIKNISHGAPSLVLETISDYFVNNQQVGAVRALQGGRGEGRGGLDPKQVQTLVPPDSRAVIWGKSVSPCVQRASRGWVESRPTCVDHPLNSLSMNCRDSQR